MAQLVDLQNKKDDAKTNYIWTISKLDEKLKMEPKDDDLRELWGLANNLYVRFTLNSISLIWNLFNFLPFF